MPVRPLDRRRFLEAALLAPAGAWLSRYRTLAAAERGRARITAVRALQLRKPNSQSLIKIETDAGLAGYGEAGAFGPDARARLRAVEPALLGQDPLAIERHFHTLSTKLHAHRAHIPTVSGIDIALWDLAGKILDRPVYQLLGGPLKERIRLTKNSGVRDPLDPRACRDWAQKLREHPSGIRMVKTGYMHLSARRTKPVTYGLGEADFARIAEAFANLREAAGPEIDIIAHGHNELDLQSAAGVGKALAAGRPLWWEDPMPIPYSDAWRALAEAVPVPLQTGEKVETPLEFLPFLQHRVVRAIQPDLAFCGGLTGARKIADLAEIYLTPVCLHNVGTLVQTLAGFHFGAATPNFVASEIVFREPEYRGICPTSAGPPDIIDGYAAPPTEPGLGVTLDEKALRDQLGEGEPWWG